MKNNKFKTMIGGQALIEGIMMRGPKKQAVVVRAPDGLKTLETEIKLIKDRYPILGIPLIRGVVGFFDSMVSGVKALTFSAEFMPEEEQEEPSKFDKWIEQKFGMEKAMKIIMGIAVFLGIVFPIALFILLPSLLAGTVDSLIASRVLRNLLEGAVRIAIFLLFMLSVSKMKDIARVFAYHGAEHKTIFCYEAGLELTVENVRAQQRQHPRCGTSFLFVVMIVSIIVFSIVSYWTNPFIKLLLRLALLPVVVGISYEINRFVGRHDNAITRIMRAPGIWLQNITTNEPDDSMIEVGIEALKLVIPEEKGKDAW